MCGREWNREKWEAAASLLNCCHVKNNSSERERKWVCVRERWREEERGRERGKIPFLCKQKTFVFQGSKSFLLRQIQKTMIITFPQQRPNKSKRILNRDMHLLQNLDSDSEFRILKYAEFLSTCYKLESIWIVYCLYSIYCIFHPLKIPQTVKSF